ncbi:flagellar motor switch protein FliN [Corallincola platygyrae]|uniref:Flagellar motor switch protein FliN n=1 Tax=Corallincola platygyrae TaxID=1193278 RepID=A0ABW4XLD8_9GAMM
MSNDNEDIPDDWAAAFAEQEAAEAGLVEEPAETSTEVAEFEELAEDESPLSAEERRKLDTILDIPVTISMEVGRSQISIRNLLQLNQGSVVELDRVAGEPLDVLVNGTLIAHGEVVVVNDKFGIRLTDVISQTERIKKLK